MRKLFHSKEAKNFARSIWGIRATRGRSQKGIRRIADLQPCFTSSKRKVLHLARKRLCAAPVLHPQCHARPHSWRHVPLYGGDMYDGFACAVRGVVQQFFPRTHIEHSRIHIVNAMDIVLAVNIDSMEQVWRYNRTMHKSAVDCTN